MGRDGRTADGAESRSGHEKAGARRSDATNPGLAVQLMRALRLWGRGLASAGATAATGLRHTDEAADSDLSAALATLGRTTGAALRRAAGATLAGRVTRTSWTSRTVATSLAALASTGRTIAVGTLALGVCTLRASTLRLAAGRNLSAGLRLDVCGDIANECCDGGR